MPLRSSSRFPGNSFRLIALQDSARFDPKISQRSENDTPFGDVRSKHMGELNGSRLFCDISSSV